jgi:polyisoprenoid-binding protein YceI
MRFLFACLLLAWASLAQGAEWKLLPASRLEFTATYQGQPVPGVFRRFSVVLAFDPQQPVGSKLEVGISIPDADMLSADINEAVRGPEWFDGGHFPVARFVSEEIVARGPGRYLARGTLNLKGVTRRVAVPFTWTQAGNGGAAMDGRLVLRRTDFNIGSGAWAKDETIGMEVGVTFGLKLQRKD